MMPHQIRRYLVVVLVVWANAQTSDAETTYAEIKVVDAATGRGIPLVELTTLSRVGYVTDNAGRVAFDEVDFLNHETYLEVHSHGYEVPRDGFGFSGVRVVPRRDEPVTIKLERTMPAERLCRLTGASRYRDSQLLGYDIPLEARTNASQLVGQDSVQVASYRGRLFWFWGDTSRASYPLGIFRTAGATTPPGDQLAHVEQGLPFQYFVGPEGSFVRNMLPLAERPEGVIWIDGLCVVPDAQGRERMVCHFERRQGLQSRLEHGLAVYNDDRDEFEVAALLSNDEDWRHPLGHATKWDDGAEKYLLFCNPAPNIRVAATLAAVLDPQQYEAFARDDHDHTWQWQQALPPTQPTDELRAIEHLQSSAEFAHFVPRSATNDARISLHRGTVHWNAHRQRWVMIAGEIGGTSSHLGEVWYAEAREPTGPFASAAKIVTHDRQTFYNVCHHPFLDQDGGRVIHFEGTYTREFSGNPHRTPRYDYNQVLYRLDLDHPALAAARVEE